MYHGRPARVFAVTFAAAVPKKDQKKTTGKMPVGLMAKMAMLHTGKMPVPRYCPYISRLMARNSSHAARRASSV